MEKEATSDTAVAELPTPAAPRQTITRVARAVTIREPASTLYRFWRDLERLPEIINHPAEIRRVSRTESHWRVSGPLGDVEWTAEIVRDEPGRLIGWQTRHDSSVDITGQIEFLPAPGDEGTEVIVSLSYDPPGGKLGATVAKFTRDSADSQIYDALKRFKALIEAGEIPTIKGQAVGGPQRPRKGEK